MAFVTGMTHRGGSESFGKPWPSIDAANHFGCIGSDRRFWGPWVEWLPRANQVIPVHLISIVHGTLIALLVKPA
jgi:hypothetical protein